MASSDRPIYLDHNATTPVDPDVLEVMLRAWRDGFANPGSRHRFGRAARRVLEESREKIAALLGAEPDEVVFTSGGTESINLALRGLARRVGTVVHGAGEHPATVETCLRLSQAGYRLHELPVDADGLLREEAVTAAPWDDVCLATLLSAHNETGVIQDVAPLADRCRERGIPLHLDAVQAVGKIPVNFHALGAAALSFGAHKFHGPRGAGGLLLRRGTKLAPLLLGGHQESERRAGTEAVPLIAGTARALEICHADLAARAAHLQSLRDRLAAGLAESCGPVIVNGHPTQRLPNTLNIAFPGLDGETLLVALDLEGIACSLGSTCASGSMEPSPILLAMSCPPEVYRSSVRFSVGVTNTEEEVHEAVRRVGRVVRGMRGAAT